MTQRSATTAELRTALDALDRNPTTISAGRWPQGLDGLDLPGLYSWWVGKGGAVDLSRNFSRPIAEGRIYAGQAGATIWPSGKTSDATLYSRIEENHLTGKVRSSTLRRTLASALLRTLDLVVLAPRKLAPKSEERLSAWMRDNLYLAVSAFPDCNALKDLEEKVLSELDPLLNLKGMARSTIRAELSDLRQLIIRPNADAPKGRQSESNPPGVPAKPRRLSRPAKSVTLHEEIADILVEYGPALRSGEIAKLVNQRARYTKKDGSLVTSSQIATRVNKRQELFVRNGTEIARRDRK